MFKNEEQKDQNNWVRKLTKDETEKLIVITDYVDSMAIALVNSKPKKDLKNESNFIAVQKEQNIGTGWSCFI